MNNILLTGATGFVGRAFNDHDEVVRRVVRATDKHDFTSTFIIDELNKSTNWDGAFVDIDTVVHLAGLAHSHSYTVSDYQAVNVEGTLKLASEAAKSGVRRFAFVSSIGVNGNSTLDIPYSSESNPAPHNAYAQSKYDAEVGLKAIADNTGMELVIVRPTLVYGANAPGNFGSLTGLVNKLTLLPFGLVSNKRDFISVENLADLLVTCAEHPKAAGHTFLASDGESVSIKEFTNAIAKGLGKPLFQLPIPVTMMRFTAKLLGRSAMTEQLLGNLQVDSSNANEILDWTPPLTMEQAMASLSERKK